VCCGLALATAGMFQQYGVKYTTVGKAGFITTLYIILTPIFGLLLGKKCRFTVWIGAVGAVIGLYMLCITERLSLSLGDLLVFICAIFFAVHILIIDYFSPKTDGVLLSCIQFLVCTVVCGVIALIVETPSIEQLRQGIIPLLYTGIMSSGVAYTLQVIGQKNFNPTIAAMIMSLESVISALASYFAFRMGWLAQDQSMTIMQILGCILMFASVIFVQLPFEKIKRRTH
ncbi:MAG: DMT family transporter, partial [Ruminococcus sp.]|nr:DMT family transporter [Ruminococcus sp.]